MKKTIVYILAALIAVSSMSSCADGAGTDPETQTTTGAEGTTGAPQTDIVQPANPGVDIMKFELSDYVTVGDYKQTIVNNVYCDDEALEAELKKLAADEGYFKKITDREAKAGDTVNISYAGRVEDVYFEGGTQNSATVSLTENNGYIDGFVDDLYGIKPGTTVQTNVTFPKNYSSVDLAGVDAVFEITLNFIYDFGFDDEAVKDLTNGSYTSAEVFTEEYRKNIIKENMADFESDVAEKIIEAVVKNCEIKAYPQELVDYYYNDIIDYYMSSASSSGQTLDALLAKYGLSRDDITDQAKDYAHEDLAMHAVFVAEGLSMSDAEYRIELNALAVQYGYSSADALETAYGEFFLKNMIRRDICTSHLRNKLTIETDYDQYKHLLEEKAEQTAEVTK